MSSFYAGIMAGAMPGGTDYSQLTNVPIINIGSETGGVTNLATLQVGHYNLKGSYTESTESSIEYTNKSHLDVLVLYDETKKKKVVEFLTVENGEMFLNYFVYEEDGTLVDKNKISVTAPAHIEWGEF